MHEPFFVEKLLFVAIPVFLFLPQILSFFSWAPSPVSRYTPETQSKKQFFVVFRLAQKLLLLVLALDCYSFLYVAEVSETLHFGNFFFRADRFIAIINFFVTSLACYYLSLLAFLFSRTTRSITYILELPFLMLCTVLCLRLLVSTTDFFLLVILLEILAFCSVIYLGLQSTTGLSYCVSIEATIKYFIINAVAVALLLLGICGYFYTAATTNVLEIVVFFQNHPHMLLFFLEQVFFSYLLVIFAFLVKVGGAPLHQWVPDVYEGAETHVTCFLVVLVSPPVFIKLLQLYKTLGVSFIKYDALATGFPEVPAVIWHFDRLPLEFFWLVAILSILVGTLGAFYQTRIKRFVAYASLTHFGFMFLAVLTGTFLGYFAAFSYFFIYVVTNMGFFTFLLLGQYYFYQTRTRLIFINQLKPFIQLSFFFFLNLAIYLFSFAGIPPFAGFFAKFFVLSALAAAQQYFTLILLVVAILVGTFMYLRFLKIVLFETISNSHSGGLVAIKEFSQSIKVAIRGKSNYHLGLNSQNSHLYVLPISRWQEPLLTATLGCSVLISFFFFFVSPYLVCIHEATVAFLTL